MTKNDKPRCVSPCYPADEDCVVRLERPLLRSLRNKWPGVLAGLFTLMALGADPQYPNSSGTTLGTAAPAPPVMAPMPAMPGMEAPRTASQVHISGVAVGSQSTPDVNFPKDQQNTLETTPWTHEIFLHQWLKTDEMPPESVLSERYIQTHDRSVDTLSLKEAIYLALKNNPGIAAASMDPVISLETVRQNWAVFDPDLTSQLDTSKTVTPSTSVLQSGSEAFTQKLYDWNAGINKVLSTTNGTLSVTFNNNRTLSNTTFAAINPSYSPNLAVSLAQPLLRNFGLNFATINVRISEINQKQAQFSYEQQLNDFILRVGTDYWNVVGAQENLAVAQDAWRLAADTVRQNEISVKVGVLAPISLQEALSQQATDEAQIYQSEQNLASARATLRADVMYNPNHTFIPALVEPSEKTHPAEVPTDEELSLEKAMMYRPELAAMREGIRSMLLQVKYAENQVLPQINLGTQIGINSTAGTTPCIITSISGATSNCTNRSGQSGVMSPFSGVYSDALNRLFGFSFYNYAAVFSFERPLDNDASKSALSQVKMEYEQQRLQYRNLIAQVVVDVQTQLAAVKANFKSARATRIASEYAAESLRQDEERFRVGLATTHELLQYQDTLVAARGQQVQAEVNFEIAKLALQHSQGTLLRYFNINFEATPSDVRPWYAHF